MTSDTTRYIKIFSCRNYSWKVVILNILVFTFLHLTAQASDFTACNECHDSDLVADYAKYKLHSPFMQQQCRECHNAQEPAARVAKKSLAAKKKLQKINWLGHSAMADTSHGFMLPGDKVGDTLVVEARGADGSFSRQEITIPLLAGLAEVQDSGSPPAISEVKVINVQRGVFLKVTIGWQTDTLSDALVRYGEFDLSQKSDSLIRLGWNHTVILNKLKPDRTYQFAAVSNDLFGRSRVSEPLTFSTSKPLAATQPNKSGNMPGGANKNRMASNFQRFGTDYLLEVTLEKPASLNIGSKGAVRKQELPGESTSAGAIAANTESHAGLSSEGMISMGVCKSCHKYNSRATHPVNVRPKPGMTIPAEYPTLPDGRITCNSCHSLHSSDYDFLSRKRHNRELCVGCHVDML